MAHPERKVYAEELSNKLQAPIIYDKINNLWDTCRRSWLSQIDSKAEYILVLQDDAIVGDNFKERAEKIIEKHEKNGDFIFSFYAGNMLGERIRHAVNNKKDHILSGAIFNEVALCMKTKHVKDMVAYCDKRETDTDHEIGKWAMGKRIKILYSVPSIVDHRAELESIFRRNYNKPMPEKPRKAYLYEE